MPIQLDLGDHAQVLWAGASKTWTSTLLRLHKARSMPLTAELLSPNEENPTDVVRSPSENH